MTFQIGDRVKATGNHGTHGDVIKKGEVYTVVRLDVDGDPILDSDTVNDRIGWGGSPFELYAKAGEFVKGDVVMPANTAGGPWTVLDVQARDDGQRICFPGEYGQWWRADAYRLATPDEIAAAEAATVQASMGTWKTQVNHDRDAMGQSWVKRSGAQILTMTDKSAEIPAADFDFSTIKAGDAIVVRLVAGVDFSFSEAESIDISHASRMFIKKSCIVSVIPAPKPKTLRERAIEAVFASVPGIVTADPDKGVVLAGGQVISLHNLVDLVLAEVEKGR